MQENDLLANDLLTEEGIRSFLPEALQEYPIFVYQSIDSTNTQAKRLAAAGAAQHSILVANEQSAGRGRQGHRFFSPADCGIYMSVIFREEAERFPLGSAPFQQDTKLVTIAAAVAVCRAIERLSERKPKIKWVNDIFLNGKKICGILTEASQDDFGKVIVVGIGLNVSNKQKDFPEELQEIAGSLGLEQVSRNALTAEIAAELFQQMQPPHDSIRQEKLLSEYRKRSLVLGKEIAYTQNGISLTGTVSGISPEGNLILTAPSPTSPTKIILQAGEIITIGSQN